MNVSGTRWEKKHNKTSFFAEQAFSAETFYAITYLEYVDNSHRRILIRKLKQLALDFKVRNKNRDKQAKAISILCYLLIEKGHEFTSEERREIFEAAFGRTLYQFQGSLWGALREQSEYYKRYAYDVFQSSLGIPIKRSLVDAYKGKPLFFFLAPHLFEKDFEVNEQRHPAFFYFLECIKIYRKTWYLSVNDVISHDDVVAALEKVRVYCLDGANTEFDTKSGSSKNPEVDRYLALYGINALLYGLSNVKNHITQINRKKREKVFVSASEVKQSQLLSPLVQDISIWFSQSQNAVDIYKSILCCDFNNRKYAKNYGSFNEDYFLLAGPVRFICAYYKELSGQIDSPISIDNDQMTQMYKNWMSFQMQKDSRYGFLLAKLLSFSDFDLEPFVSVELFADTSFLPYDNIGDSYKEFAKECLFRWDAKRFSNQSK